MGYRPALLFGQHSTAYSYQPVDVRSSTTRVCVECTMPASGQWQSVSFYNGLWTGTRGSYYDYAVYTINDTVLDPRGTLLRTGTVSFPDNNNAIATFASPIPVNAGDRYVFEVYPNATFSTSNWVRWNTTKGGIDRAWYSNNGGASWITYSEWTDMSALYALTIDGTTYDRRQPSGDRYVSGGGEVKIYATASNSYRCGNRIRSTVPWLLYRVRVMSLYGFGTSATVQVSVYGANGLIATSINKLKPPASYRDHSFRFNPVVIPAGDVVVAVEVASPPEGDTTNRTDVRRAIVPTWVQSPWFLPGAPALDVASATSSALTISSLSDFSIDNGKQALMEIFGVLKPKIGALNLGGGFNL